MDKNLKRILLAPVIDHVIHEALYGENLSQGERKELIEFCKEFYSKHLADENEDQHPLFFAFYSVDIMKREETFNEECLFGSKMLQ